MRFAGLRWLPLALLIHDVSDVVAQTTDGGRRFLSAITLISRGCVSCASRLY